MTRRKKVFKYDIEQYIERVREFNADRYSFEKSVYVNRETDVVVTCTKHNIDVTRKAYVFIRNVHGKKPRMSCCPECIKEFKAANKPRPKIKWRPVKIRFPKPKKIPKPRQTLFTYKDGNKYYLCERHGEVGVGKTRKYNLGCPSCNIENYKAGLAAKKAKKEKEKVVVVKPVSPRYYDCPKHGKVIIGAHRKRNQGCPSCNIEKHQKTFVSYEDAKARVNGLGIRSHSEYRKWKKRTCQDDLPANPEKSYKDKGWQDFYEFFGNDRVMLMSNGEKRVHDYLLKKGVCFEPQKKFEDCRNIMPLPFDFYLPDFDACIEFDGQQHFRPANFSSCQEENQRKFERTKKHDGIKTKYCIDNSITLIRLDDYHLANNILEWELDNELTRIAAVIAADSM